MLLATLPRGACLSAGSSMTTKRGKHGQFRCQRRGRWLLSGSKASLGHLLQRGRRDVWQGVGPGNTYPPYPSMSFQIALPEDTFNNACLQVSCGAFWCAKCSELHVHFLANSKWLHRLMWSCGGIVQPSALLHCHSPLRLPQLKCMFVIVIDLDG